MGRKRRRRTEIERLSENGGNAKTFQDVTMKRTVKQIGTETNKGMHKQTNKTADSGMHFTDNHARGPSPFSKAVLIRFSPGRAA